MIVLFFSFYSIMTSYTVELSEFHGDSGSNNGEWTNTFQNKLSLESGDVLQIKQALINTQAADVATDVKEMGGFLPLSAHRMGAQSP
eukprot:m.22523 g.22523  ORF g.22523 m.22523 type:complete len:87 (+) comp5825_c0_seq1:3-263(+)